MQKMGDINGVFGRFFRMVLVAQLARASGCGPEGRRFEPDRAHPPFARNSNELRAFLLPRFVFPLFLVFSTCLGIILVCHIGQSTTKVQPTNMY